MTSSVSLGRNESSDTLSSASPDSSGTISTCSRLSRDSWFSTSKVRMLSMSSPKKSMRKGYSLL